MPLFAVISGILFKDKDNSKLLREYLYPCIIFSIAEIVSWRIFYEGVSLYSFGWTMWYLWSLFWYMLITPVLLRKISLKGLFFISFALAIIVGFTPLSYLFQLSRLVTFYPFFLIGIWLQKHLDYILDEKRNRSMWILLTVSSFIVIAALFHVYPSIRPYVNFNMPYYTFFSMFKRIAMYGICIVPTLALIYASQNREHWYTKYGARTMNAYLCHMVFVIFPISFCFTIPIMHTWYGYVINLVCVPMICCLFYTDAWSRVMNFILLKRAKRDTMDLS